MLDKSWLKSASSFLYEDDRREKTPLVTLDSNDVCELGNMTRDIAGETLTSYGSPRISSGFSLAVDVSTADGHSLFRSTISSGTSAINDLSIVENRKASILYGCSSYALKEESTTSNFSFCTKHPHGKSSEFRYFGGAVPIFVENVHFPVACLTVDGDYPRYDHYIAMRSLQEFAKRQRDEREKLQTQKQQQRDEEIVRQVSKKLEEENHAQRLDGGAWKLFHSHS